MTIKWFCSNVLTITLDHLGKTFDHLNFSQTNSNLQGIMGYKWSDFRLWSDHLPFIDHLLHNGLTI